jgi:hypothetical protein
MMLELRLAAPAITLSLFWASKMAAFRSMK